VGEAGVVGLYVRRGRLTASESPGAWFEPRRQPGLLGVQLPPPLLPLRIRRRALPSGSAAAHTPKKQMDEAMEYFVGMAPIKLFPGDPPATKRKHQMPPGKKNGNWRPKFWVLFATKPEMLNGGIYLVAYLDELLEKG